MKKLLCISLFLLSGAVLPAHAQGTPGVLRCSFNGSLEVHATRDSSSRIIANIKCGDPVLLIEQRSGASHVRTQSGQDGYIVGMNLGEWSIEPTTSAPPSPASTTAPGTTPAGTTPANNRQPAAIVDRIAPARKRAPQEKLRKFDIGGDVSYSRQGSVELYGGDLSLTTHVWEGVGIVADVAVHSTTVSPTVTTLTYRFGPRFYAGRTRRVSAFGEFLVGGTRITGSSSSLFPAGIAPTATSKGLNGFALAAGAGVEVTISPWLAWRAVHADYSLLRFGGSVSDGARIGTGIVFRFGK